MRRILSALVLLTLVGAAIWVLPLWATAALAATAAVLAGVELANMAARAGARVPPSFVGLAAAALTIAFWMYGAGTRQATADLVGAVVLAIVVAAGLVVIRLGPPAQDGIARAAILVMGPAYLGLPLGTIVWTQGAFGPAATTWLLGTIVLSDSAQYYCGRLFGRARLAPAISPAKTVEGAIGGLAAAAIAGWFLGPMSVAGISAATGSALGAALASFGIAGDLFESYLKRSAGVKDSSDLIPGHGGVLDRIDSYLFAAPAFYCFLRFVR
jgi:phosphatidate cytidylyltransferase